MARLVLYRSSTCCAGERAASGTASSCPRAAKEGKHEEREQLKKLEGETLKTSDSFHVCRHRCKGTTDFARGTKEKKKKKKKKKDPPSLQSDPFVPKHPLVESYRLHVSACSPGGGKVDFLVGPVWWVVGGVVFPLKRPPCIDRVK